MFALLLALIASGGYGTADFFGGRAARRFAPSLVVLYVQIAQAAAVAALIPLAGQTFDGAAIRGGAVAGVANAVGLILSYRALATGRAGIVAPLVACGPVIPIVLTFLRGDSLGWLTLFGLLAVFAGIIVSAAVGEERAVPDEDENDAGVKNPSSRFFSSPISLALASAVAFGFFFVFVERAEAGGNDLMSVTLGVQLGTIPVAALAALFNRTKHFDWRLFSAASFWFVVVCNLIGDLALTYAVQNGNLAVVSVFASLGPIVTGLLARLILGERLTGWQYGGACLTVIGIICVAAFKN